MSTWVVESVPPEFTNVPAPAVVYVPAPVIVPYISSASGLRSTPEGTVSELPALLKNVASGSDSEPARSLLSPVTVILFGYEVLAVVSIPTALIQMPSPVQPPRANVTLLDVTMLGSAASEPPKPVVLVIEMGLLVVIAGTPPAGAPSDSVPLPSIVKLPPPLWGMPSPRPILEPPPLATSQSKLPEIVML